MGLLSLDWIGLDWTRLGRIFWNYVTIFGWFERRALPAVIIINQEMKFINLVTK